jgi:hypothetical protein
VVAFLLEAAGALAVWYLARAAYGPDPSLAWPPPRAPLVAALAAGGVLAGAVALRGLWRLHRLRPPLPAFLLTVFPYAPVVAVASGQTWALLVLLGAW